MNIIFHLTYVS